MTTRLYLVRHGETVWNRENRVQGWTDIELNAAGRGHANALARSLRNAPLRAVYASTLSRAQATAQAIAGPHNLPVIVDADLRELNQGTLDGLTFDDLRRDYADLLREWGARAASLRMPDGESLAELQERAWTAIQRIVRAHPDGQVAAVSHNLTIVAILCRALGINLNDFRRLRQDVAAVNVLDLGGPLGPAVIRVNDTGHLRSAEPEPTNAPSLRETGRFRPATVPSEDVARIVAALGKAGLHRGACHVLVVGGQERRYALGSALREAKAERLAAALESASLALAVVTEEGETALTRGLGAALQNLRLTALALGYGTAWLAGSECAGAAASLSIAPPSRLAALLALGIPADATEPGAEAAAPPGFTVLD